MSWVRRNPTVVSAGSRCDAVIRRRRAPGTTSASSASGRIDRPSEWLPGLVAIGLLVFVLAPLGGEFRDRGVQTDRLPRNVALVAFIAIYLWALLREGMRPAGLRALGGALVLLAIATWICLVDRASNWAVLFVAAAAVGGRLVPSRRALFVIVTAAGAAAVVLQGTGSGFAAGRTFERTLESVFEVALVGLGMLGFSQLERTARQLDRAQGEVARLAADGERARIARDLHDLLGHSLSLVALKAELARRMLGRDPARAAQELSEVETLVRTSLRDVREAVAGYRRVDLDTELAGARIALLAAGIPIEIERPLEAFDPATDTLLGWVVREGTTNVVRHSGAAKCSIRVETTKRQVRLEITDDGRERTDADRASVGAVGHGLIGIRERVEAAGGEMDAGQRAGGGYRLAVTIPVRDPAPPRQTGAPA